MAKKKSAAQIRRMQERAAKRGETFEYVPPTEQEQLEENSAKEGNPEEEMATTTPLHDESTKEDTGENQKRREVAARLIQELKDIETNEDIKSKDRRSAKRKAEAIASEEVGMPMEELIQWFEKNKQEDSGSNETEVADPKFETKKKAAMKLKRALDELTKNEDLKSKDRRSGKRKAEAIATEETDMAPEALLEWWNQQSKKVAKTKSNSNLKSKEKNHDPYIAFIGQLSFDTTSAQLMEHIRSNLEKDFPKVRKHDIKIRMLTDSKTKKSRGMAFCEVDDPELLYGLLKLHQTFLLGRRINIERSAGGNKNSANRQSKIKQYRKEQDEYFAEVMDSILGEYKKTGELRDDELDEGVIALCKRHSGPVVQAALAKYIEGSGRDMDNPSAYLTFLITKFAEEGVYEEREGNQNKHNEGPRRKRRPDDGQVRGRGDGRGRGGGGRGGGGGGRGRGGGRGGGRGDGRGGGRGGGAAKRFKASSEFARSGIDMSNSEGRGGGSKMSNIFPSARRGRGYMM